MMPQERVADRCRGSRGSLGRRISRSRTRTLGTSDVIS